MREGVRVVKLVMMVCLAQGEYGSGSCQGKSVGLLKPTTFMNLSGQSVSKVSGQ